MIDVHWRLGIEPPTTILPTRVGIKQRPKVLPLTVLSDIRPGTAKAPPKGRSRPMNQQPMKPLTRLMSTLTDQIAFVYTAYPETTKAPPKGRSQPDLLVLTTTESTPLRLTNLPPHLSGRNPLRGSFSKSTSVRRIPHTGQRSRLSICQSTSQSRQQRRTKRSDIPSIVASPAPPCLPVPNPHLLVIEIT